ncbi:hypothetical protein [uncultured Roseobacter sp.]|uniref:hypothetical protein n=1 Tax=uncultured Roseobacter sp. TaxID=114847 RepID=UPI002616CD2C|nr:hypothetical protein [uncultured Roseobacter sp.]
MKPIFQNMFASIRRFFAPTPEERMSAVVAARSARVKKLATEDGLRGTTCHGPVEAACQETTAEFNRIAAAKIKRIEKQVDQFATASSGADPVGAQKAVQTHDCVTTREVAAFATSKLDLIEEKTAADRNERALRARYGGVSVSLSGTLADTLAIGGVATLLVMESVAVAYSLKDYAGSPMAAFFSALIAGILLTLPVYLLGRAIRPLFGLKHWIGPTLGIAASVILFVGLVAPMVVSIVALRAKAAELFDLAEAMDIVVPFLLGEGLKTLFTGSLANWAMAAVLLFISCLSFRKGWIGGDIVPDARKTAVAKFRASKAPKKLMVQTQGSIALSQNAALTAVDLWRKSSLSQASATLKATQNALATTGSLQAALDIVDAAPDHYARTYTERFAYVSGLSEMIARPECANIALRDRLEALSDRALTMQHEAISNCQFIRECSAEATNRIIEVSRRANQQITHPAVPAPNVAVQAELFVPAVT